MLKLIVLAEIAKSRVAELLKDRTGVTAMEYGIIAATTVVIVGGVIGGINGSLTTIWDNIGTKLAAAAT